MKGHSLRKRHGIALDNPPFPGEKSQNMPYMCMGSRETITCCRFPDTPDSRIFDGKFPIEKARQTVRERNFGGAEITARFFWKTRVVRQKTLNFGPYPTTPTHSWKISQALLCQASSRWNTCRPPKAAQNTTAPFPLMDLISVS